MTAFAAAIREPGSLKVGYQFPNLGRHLLNAPFYVA
jgi:hypothetical protein